MSEEKTGNQYHRDHSCQSAGGVKAARPATQQGGGGANPTSALQQIRVEPIPILVAKGLVEREHYLHSLSGGTQLAFGVFLEPRLLGAMTLAWVPPTATSW